MTPLQRAREGADRTLSLSQAYRDAAVYGLISAVVVTAVVAAFLFLGGCP